MRAGLRKAQEVATTESPPCRPVQIQGACRSEPQAVPLPRRPPDCSNQAASPGLQQSPIQHSFTRHASDVHCSPVTWGVTGEASLLVPRSSQCVGEA